MKKNHLNEKCRCAQNWRKKQRRRDVIAKASRKANRA